VDAWDAYCQQVAELSPRIDSRLVELHTDSGLRVTTSEARFLAYSQTSGVRPAVLAAGRADGTSWWHGVQPVWSLDPLWLRHAEICWRYYRSPNRVRLSRLDPVLVQAKHILYPGNDWRPDANCEGGPLESGGHTFGWGFGVHASTELHFQLPEFSSAVHSWLGLDGSIGEGGCVQARVLLGSGDSPPEELFRSPPLVGSRGVIRTDRLPLRADDASETAGSPLLLILAVDADVDNAPEGADPFDIRDRFNWLEPELEVDAAVLAKRLGRYVGRLIPAWQGWELVSEPIATNRWDSLDSRDPCFRLHVAPRDEAVVLRRQVQVTSAATCLLVGVGRCAPGTTSGRIQVAVDGQRLADWEVPVLETPQLPAPRRVLLGDYQGREVLLEVRHVGDGPASFVDWYRLEVRGQKRNYPPKARGQKSEISAGLRQLTTDNRQLTTDN